MSRRVLSEEAHKLEYQTGRDQELWQWWEAILEPSLSESCVDLGICHNGRALVLKGVHRGMVLGKVRKVFSIGISFTCFQRQYYREIR